MRWRRPQAWRSPLESELLRSRRPDEEARTAARAKQSAAAQEAARHQVLGVGMAAAALEALEPQLSQVQRTVQLRRALGRLRQLRAPDGRCGARRCVRAVVEEHVRTSARPRERRAVPAAPLRYSALARAKRAPVVRPEHADQKCPPLQPLQQQDDARPPQAPAGARPTAPVAGRTAQARRRGMNRRQTSFATGAVQRRRR